MNIYVHSTCSVKINELLTNWFQSQSGLKQGDTLSPTVYGTFINDFIRTQNSELYLFNPQITESVQNIYQIIIMFKIGVWETSVKTKRNITGTNAT